ncbi:MAG TPA: DUF4124 domain-containing protein [Rhodanobacteraceae bacterium]|nr:DUF4124 domain-containing protein [Rhodanobacteraceae bacterium]
MRRWMFALIVFATLPCLAASQVYRWTDAHGVAHFSDAPPPRGVPYQVVDLATGASTQPPASPAQAQPPAAATVAAAPAASASAAPARAPDTPANRTALCKNLAHKIKLLASDRPLTESPGSSVILSDDQRRQRLSLARGDFAKFCSISPVH